MLFLRLKCPVPSYCITAGVPPTSRIGEPLLLTPHHRYLSVSPEPAPTFSHRQETNTQVEDLNLLTQQVPAHAEGWMDYSHPNCSDSFARFIQCGPSELPSKTEFRPKLPHYIHDQPFVGGFHLLLTSQSLLGIDS